MKNDGPEELLYESADEEDPPEESRAYDQDEDMYRSGPETVEARRVRIIQIRNFRGVAGLFCKMNKDHYYIHFYRRCHVSVIRIHSGFTSMCNSLLHCSGRNQLRTRTHPGELHAWRNRNRHRGTVISGIPSEMKSGSTVISKTLTIGAR